MTPPLQSHRNTWRMIVVTTFMSLLVFGVTTAALRAAAQGTGAAAPAPAPAPAAPPATAADSPATVSREDAPAEDPTLREETTRRANEARPSDELPPDLRESADNNISFPVDI